MSSGPSTLLIVLLVGIGMLVAAGMAVALVLIVWNRKRQPQGFPIQSDPAKRSA